MSTEEQKPEGQDSEDQDSEDQDSAEIISIKTNTGELFDGEYLGTKKVFGRDVHILKMREIERYVPVLNCEWWCLGDQSAKEVRQQIQKEMREEAKFVLMEMYQEESERLENPTNSEEDQQQEDQQQEEPTNLERIQKLRERVIDKNNRGVQQAVHRIADHQRSIFNQNPPETSVVQPGEDSLQRRVPLSPQGRSSIARLSDEDSEI